MSAASIRCIFCSKYLTSGTSPRQADCGDRLCGACFTQRGLVEVVCPACKDTINLANSFRDKAVEQETANLTVKCSNAACPWEGLCVHVEDHEAQCKFGVVRCPNSGCSVTVQRQELEAHKGECFHQVVQCQYCGLTLPRGDIQGHLGTDCPGVEVECRNKCGHRAKRGMMEDHLRSECTQQSYKCSYANCSYQGSTKELQAHEANNVAHHIKCVHKTLKELENTVEKFKNSGAAFQAVPTNTQTEKIATERERAVNQLVADLTSKFQSLSSSMNKVEPLVSQLQEAVNDMGLTLQTLQATTYDGRFVWKIPEVARRRREARSGKTVSLYSAPFYTSRHGYKVCLRLYMNGDGSGKGSHLSFFITLMRGEYDALLPWPFKQAVTLTLVDQNKQRDIIQSFRPEPTSSSFQRPRNEMNIASGCPMFAPVSVLDNGSYVKDDTMFLKCKIDIAGLEALY